MSAWIPILDGALAAAAASTLDDIAASIGNHSNRPEELVVFWAYGGDLHRAPERSAEAIARLLAGLHERANAFHLYGGLAGVGWTLAHVGDPDDCKEILSAIDTTFLRVLSAGWVGDYDLIRGIAGMAVYFLERLDFDPTLSAPAEGLDRIVEYFRATAIVGPSGLTWHTAPADLPNWQRELAPDGLLNCGVAHGAPGAISVLARIAARGSTTARELVAGATKWLDAQRLPTGGFPSWIIPGVEPSPARTAWCYGDPGIALASWSAAVRVGAPIAEWRELALECTRHPAVGIFDAMLCHGAFGLAHMFNRCFQATGERAFRDAAIRWIEHGIGMRRPGTGVAGFQMYSSPDDKPTWTTTDAFLDGAAGIGLALLAALGATEPNWDRLLAIDLPMR